MNDTVPVNTAEQASLSEAGTQSVTISQVVAVWSSEEAAARRERAFGLGSGLSALALLVIRHNNKYKKRPVTVLLTRAALDRIRIHEGVYGTWGAIGHFGGHMEILGMRVVEWEEVEQEGKIGEYSCLVGWNLHELLDPLKLLAAFPWGGRS